MGYFPAGYYTPQHFGHNYWRETPVAPAPPTPDTGGGAVVVGGYRPRRTVQPVVRDTRRERLRDLFKRLARLRAEQQVQLMRDDEDLLAILSADEE